MLQYKLIGILIASTTTTPLPCNQTSNLTSLNLSECHKHNGWRIFDKCFSQSELLFHNAPVLNSLSRTIQSNVNGAQLSRTNVCQSCTNLADEKHFHSTCGLTFPWLSNTFVLKSFALKKKVILLQVGLQIEPCSVNPYCVETYVSRRYPAPQRCPGVVRKYRRWSNWFHDAAQRIP